MALEAGVDTGWDRDGDASADLGKSAVGGLGAFSWGASLGMRPGRGLGVDLDVGLTFDLGANLGSGAPAGPAAGGAGEGEDGGGGLQPDRQEGVQGLSVPGSAGGGQKPGACRYPTVPVQKGGCCWPWGGQGIL